MSLLYSGTGQRKNCVWRSEVSGGKPTKAWSSEGVLFQKEGLMAKGNGVASVGVNFGVTLKTGDYEFARIDISYIGPCDPTARDDAYKDAKDFVSNKVNDEIKSIRESLKK